MRRRTLLGIVGVGIVVLAGTGLALTQQHVRHVTGRPDAGPASCLRCHGTATRTVYLAGERHADPRNLAVLPDGRRVLVTCGPIDGLAVVDVERRTESRLVLVPGRPRAVAVSPDGKTIAVSLEDVDQVALLDADDLTERARIRVGRYPAGVAFGTDGTLLFVGNRRSSDVSVVDVATATEQRRVAAGREPTSLARSPDGATIAVVSRMSEIGRAADEPYTLVTLLDGASARVLRRVRLPSCHMAEDVEFLPDGTRLLIPALRVRNLAPIVQVARGWVMSSVLVTVDPANGAVALLPLGDVNTCLPDPSGIAISADGAHAWIASGGAASLARVDLAVALALEGEARPDMPERLSFAARYVTGRAAVGDNPRDVALVGDTVVVAERLGDSVALLSAATSATTDGAFGVIARVPVGPQREAGQIRRGERVFHDATYAFQESFSCRSCHPDGHTDGLTYDFDIDGVGRNVLLNRSLQGVKGTAPFKWSGLNPTLARQCGARFAMVLTRADPFPDDALDDLVAYLQSLPPPRSDPGAALVGGRPSGAAERGLALFERTTRKDGTPIPPDGRCVTCHPAPHYTNRLKADVGTGGRYDTHTEFDVPHLSGIQSKAPYLHDGRALTLEEIWTAPDVFDKHGAMTDLDKRDLNDLVEFLKGL